MCLSPKTITKKQTNNHKSNPIYKNRWIKIIDLKGEERAADDGESAEVTTDEK